MSPNMQSTNTFKLLPCSSEATYFKKRRYCVNLITASQDLLAYFAPGGALNLTTSLSPFQSITWAIGHHIHRLFRSKKRLVTPTGGCGADGFSVVALEVLWQLSQQLPAPIGTRALLYKAVWALKHPQSSLCI